MLRGERACRTCYEDATSKLLPWNLGITELKFNEVPQFHLTQTRPDIKTYNTINTLKQIYRMLHVRRGLKSTVNFTQLNK